MAPKKPGRTSVRPGPTKSKPAAKSRSKPSKAGATRAAKPTPSTRAHAPRPPKPADIAASDPVLFQPLTLGEIADAIRTLTEDKRVAGMAKIGRYRVIATEPLVVKPPHWMSGHRLARVIVYDYAADRCVDACIDLDAGVVAHLAINRAQPMLSREEEAVAVSIATLDERVSATLSLGDEALATMHYWGKDSGDMAYSRRSAAVVFGRADGHPSLVAIVDLIDNSVTSVVPAAQW